MTIRRIKAVLAVLAVLVVMVANAAPAMADEWWDDWWDNCEWTWHFSLFWGWFLTCDNPGWEPVSNSWEPVDNGWDPNAPHGG